MKALTMLIAALGISMAGALAQVPQGPPTLPAARTETTPDQQADLLKEMPELSPAQVEHLVSFQSHTLRTVLGVNVEYTGVLPELRRADNPWQLVNPFAPADYGVGYDTPGFGVGTERASGFILFAIRF